MSSSMFLSAAFSDLISAWFDRATINLEREYQYKHDIRHSVGLDTETHDEQLWDEWKFKYNKLIKQRNWLWYNMKSENYFMLDSFFETDFCYEFMERKAKIEYELYYNTYIKDRYKYINRQPAWVPFSRSNLPIEEISKFDYTFFEEECNLDVKKSKCTYRRKHRSYESLVDNNRVYKKTTIDNRDYNRIYENSILLRKIIEFVQQLRIKCKVPSIIKSKLKRNNSMIELNDLAAYQSNDKPTIVMSPSNLDSQCPCGYCPSISCLVCYKGEGCCECCGYCAKFGMISGHPTCLECRKWNRLMLFIDQPNVRDPRFEGNVEQDVGGDSNVVQQDRAKNVLLTETEITQCDRAGISSIRWSPYISNDTVSSFDNMVNRWFRVGTYKWTTQNARGTTLLSLNLPRDAIFAGTSTCNQPNTIPFRIHRYWRGNIRVKVHINCNKFQIGQLQLAWYYQPKADGAFTNRNNIYTKSGTHHTVISAAPNNEVELVIPYHAFKSAFHTKSHPGDNLSLPLDLGTLFVTVLSPLKTTGETSMSCSYTVFVKFEDNEFTGMMAGDVDVPSQVKEVATEESTRYEMDALGTLLPLATTLVENVLTPSRNDNNRDNPPDVQPPSFFVPTASHSWSNGTDISEPLHNLRLSGTAQTRHPDTTLDEMTIDVLKRKFMLQDIVQWSQQQSAGTLLYSIPVNPIPPKDRIPIAENPGANLLPSYQLSTIGFLSSLYQYWRGSIEFRFDFVASQFHSGKILAAYIPGIAEGATITLEQARASPHVVISLDNAMSYTWKVPYVADKPWWPRRYAGESVTNNTVSPSKLFIFVLNELVLADTVSDNIDIMIYVRGGEDMEFSVPVQPSIGLGYDRNYISTRNTSQVYPVGNTSTYYYGSWVYSVSGVLVARRAPTSDAYAVFSEPILDQPVYYRLFPPAPAPTTPVIVGSSTRYSVDYCVFLKTTSTYGGYVCYPIHTRTGNQQAAIARVEQIAREAFANNYEPGSWMNQFIISGTSTAGFISNNVTTTSNTYGGGTSFPWTATTVSPTLEFEVVHYEGNREQSFELLDNNRLLASTSSGYMTFGESFTDLKDLCRRWQIYGVSTIPKSNIERDPGACSLLIPLLPQGLALEFNTSTKVNQIWNRAREGHIPLIASLYRYFRGSLRIRIIVSNAEGLIAWVQHKPDRVLTRTVITSCERVSTAEAVFNHTYGVYIQDMSVNRVIELEIPYYQAANYGLLQKPIISTINEWNSFYSLGELSVGFFGETPAQDVRLTCYYSIADDMRFNVFQGVPPMILLDDLPEFQGGLSNWFKKKTEAASDIAIEKVKESLVPEIESTISSLMEKLTVVTEGAKTAIQELHIKEKIMSIVGQLVQACANPEGKTIAIAITSILITLGIITFAMFNTLSAYVRQIWDYLSNMVSSPKLREEGEEASTARFEDEATNNAITGLFTLVCGGLCTVFGIKKDFKHGLSSDKLFANIDRGMKLSNVCFVFMKNILSVIGDLKVKLISYLYPSYDIAQAVMEGRDVIERWTEASLYLVDPTISRNIKYSLDLQNSFFDCYAMGKILKVKSLELQYPSLIQHVNSIYHELKKVAIDLMAQGIDPIVRKLPFTIYNVGEPGIGKSHLTTNMCAELCKAEEIKSETGLLCILNSSSKFWDHCDRQPCLVIDDVFNIKKGQMLEDQIATIFNVVTPVPLLPPKAAVEDKGRPYNPEIFVMNSNVAFFKTEICDLQALYRRRDIIIFTELDPEFKKEGCEHCEKKLKLSESTGVNTLNMLSDNHHLRFKYTFDVKNENCKKLPEDKYLKYPELIEVLKKAFSENRRDENIRFAQRVQDNMVICETRTSVVGNVLNLEQEWNNAIAKRHLRQEFYRNQTWKTVANEFKIKLQEKCDELKHDVLRKIYSFCQPFHNKYAMKNELCAECVRIKYQCGMCKTKMLKLLSEPNEETIVPSTSRSTQSSSSSIEIISPEVEQGIEAFVEEEMKSRYQSDDVHTVPRSFDVDFLLPENTKVWLHKLASSIDDETFEHFNLFLRSFSQVIAYRLDRYPLNARNVTIFKHCCEYVTHIKDNTTDVCYHDLDVNPPHWTSTHGIFFVNPSAPALPSKLNVNFTCTTACKLALPWNVDRLIKYCKDKGFPGEAWMGQGEMVVPSRSAFDVIFGNLVKWVWNFYYEKLKPTAKSIWCFLSSFDGFLGGLTVFSLLFSVIGMGIGIVHTVKATEALEADLSDKRQNFKTTGRYNPSGSSSSQYSVPKVTYDPYSNPIPSTSGFSAIKYQNKTYDGSRPKVAKIRRPRVPSKPKFESAQQFQVVEKLLEKNLVTVVSISKCQEGTKRYEAACLMLMGQEMLFEKHYLTTWQNHPINTKYYLQSPHTITDRTPMGLEFNLHDCPIKYYGDVNAEYDDTNFCIMSLPLTCPSFKDIRQFIAKSVEHEYIDMSNCWLYDNKLRRSRHCNMHLRGTEITDGSSWLRIDECYSYQYTEIGMCGSILMCASLERPIIGMHFGGTGAVGFAEPMCVEMFKDCEDERQYVYETFDMETDDIEEPKITLRTLLYPQGQVPKEHAANQGSRSQYIPSKIFDTYKNDCEPNPLSTHDRRLPMGSHPLRDGCEFMGMPPKDFPSSLVDPAAEHLQDVVLATVKPIRPKVELVSLQDAICGNKHVEGFEPLEWSTSEGFPLKSLRPKNVSGKRWLFDLEETEDGYKLKGMHGELRRQLYLGKKLRKQKIECPTVFTDCLKDTVVPIEKCSIPGKTRIFSISPVQYTIAFKQYFGDFLASYTKARLNCEHGIGINCDSIEWTFLAEKLTSKGSKIIAGDYKNFGPSLMLKCVKKCFDIIMKWYECYDPDEERQTIRRVLLAEILHARHLCANVMYTVPCGIPSGSPITAPLNSLVNCLYLRCAWLDVTSKPLSEFDSNVNVVVYGDDVCINVSDEVCDIFNTVTLNEFFKKYDIVFTDVDKSDNIIPYKTLDEVTFLKRGFKRHPHHKFLFLAPIEVRSIYKCTNWISRKGDAISSTLENCVQACELAFGHGPQFYNDVKTTLMLACNKRLSVSFRVPSWSEKSERCFNIG